MYMCIPKRHLILAFQNSRLSPSYPDVIGEEGKGRITIVPDAGVDYATSQKSATLDVILGGVQVFVHLRFRDIVVEGRNSAVKYCVSDSLSDNIPASNRHRRPREAADPARP